jgi:hypothetical protein
MRSVLAALPLALLVAGCAATSSVPTSGAQERTTPRDLAGYLPVHDIPPPRPETVLSEPEQAKAMSALLAARDAQRGMIAAAARVDAERDAAERRIAEERRREALARAE